MHLIAKGAFSVTVHIVFSTLEFVVAVFHTFCAVLSCMGVVVRATIQTLLHKRINPSGWRWTIRTSESAFVRAPTWSSIRRVRRRFRTTVRIGLCSIGSLIRSISIVWVITVTISRRSLNPWPRVIPTIWSWITHLRTRPGGRVLPRMGPVTSSLIDISSRGNYRV